MSKIKDRILLPDGKFGEMPKKQIDQAIKKGLKDPEPEGPKEEPNTNPPKSAAIKKKANKKAISKNKALAAKQKKSEQSNNN